MNPTIKTRDQLPMGKEERALRRILWALIQASGGGIEVSHKWLLKAPSKPRFHSKMESNGTLRMWPNGEE